MTLSGAIVALSLTAGCMTTQITQPDPAYAVIAAYVDAYNRRDVEAMSALMHPDIQWLSISGRETTVVADRKADLTDQMRRYVAGPSATTSTLSAPVVDGAFVAVREAAAWRRQDGSTGRQSALAVYEIERDRVRRVWYYPSSR